MLLPRMIEVLRAVRGDAAVCDKAIVLNHLRLSVAKDTAGPTLRFRRGDVTVDHADPLLPEASVLDLVGNVAGGCRPN